MLGAWLARSLAARFLKMAPNSAAPVSAAPFEPVLASELDFAEVAEFLRSDFSKNEPLNAALHLEWSDLSVFMKDLILSSLQSRLSYLLRNEEGKLIGLQLNSFSSLDKLRAEQKPEDDGVLEPISIFLWSLDQGFVSKAPAGVNKVMKFEIMNINKQYTRRGLASKLFKLSLARADELNLPVISEATALASQAIFAKNNFQVLEEILHENFLDKDGKRIFVCLDGTTCGQLVYRPPSKL